MRIDGATFSRSFFYMGPGYDIQPLMRFTHLCDTFLYPNLYLDRQPVEAWYDATLAKTRDIEVLDKHVSTGFDPREVCDLGPEPCTDVFGTFGMNHRETMDFLFAFRGSRDRERFAITWRLQRRSTGRHLTLYFFTWEALEAYAALSRGGRHAPRVLCTIETGILESPQGLLGQFFLDPSRARPLVWVRGFEPAGIPQFRHDRRDALDAAGVFSVRAMPFNHRWSCGDSYPAQMTDERYCYGFITEETAERLRRANWAPQFQDERHRFTAEGIERALVQVGESGIVVMPRRLIEQLAPGFPRVHAWETILPMSEASDGEITIAPAAEQIAALRQFLDHIDPQSKAVVHIVPWCLEDENEPYRKALPTLRHKTITYCPALADLLDLKESGSAVG